MDDKDPASCRHPRKSIGAKRNPESADAIRQAEADLAEAAQHAGADADLAGQPAPEADAATTGAGSAD